MNTGFEITVDGEVMKVYLEDLTGAETKLFRQAVGMSTLQAMQESLDLDLLAGFVWLHRRRNNPALTYEQVAAELTWRSIENVTEPASEDDSPEV